MIYLYVKTHNITGKKYFGKTAQDPNKYKGSGIIWEKHIHKYGYDVDTQIIGEFLDEELAKKIAIDFSIENNIVDDPIWCNLIIEKLDGGDTSKTPNFLKYKTTISDRVSKSKWWNDGINQKFCELQPGPKWVNGRLPFNNTGSTKGASAQRGKFWINNGSQELMSNECPNGWTLGRLKKNFSRLKTPKGTRWWNNGIVSVMSPEAPNNTYSPGRLPFRNKPIKF